MAYFKDNTVNQPMLDYLSNINKMEVTKISYSKQMIRENFGSFNSGDGHASGEERMRKRGRPGRRHKTEYDFSKNKILPNLFEAIQNPVNSKKNFLFDKVRDVFEVLNTGIDDLLNEKVSSRREEIQGSQYGWIRLVKSSFAQPKLYKRTVFRLRGKKILRVGVSQENLLESMNTPNFVNSQDSPCITHDVPFEQLDFFLSKWIIDCLGMYTSYSNMIRQRMMVSNAISLVGEDGLIGEPISKSFKFVLGSLELENTGDGSILLICNSSNANIVLTIKDYKQDTIAISQPANIRVMIDERSMIQHMTIDLEQSICVKVFNSMHNIRKQVEFKNEDITKENVRNMEELPEPRESLFVENHFDFNKHESEKRLLSAGAPMSRDMTDYAETDNDPKWGEHEHMIFDWF